MLGEGVVNLFEWCQVLVGVELEQGQVVEQGDGYWYCGGYYY